MTVSRKAFFEGWKVAAEWAAGRAETRCMCDWGDSAPPEVNTADIHRPGCPAAGRAETTTATTEDAQTGTFEAILAAHRDEYDSDCGMYFGCSCGWDNDDIGSNEGYVEHVAGLLATARTRPTREQIAQAITSGFLGTKHSSEFWKKGTARNAQDNYLRAADAVLALLADQPTKADTTTNREGPHG